MADNPPNQSEELKEILAKTDLWNWNFSYVEIGQSYSGRLCGYAWSKLSERDKKEMIATATLAPLAALVTGVYAGVSWQSLFTGMRSCNKSA